MNIDEVIENFKYDAENNRADLDLEFAKENEQLAEWLTQLKEYQQLEELIGMPMRELAEIFQKHIPKDCKHLKKAIVLTDGDNSNARDNEPCYRCDSKNTNADKIRNMSDEELAEFFAIHDLLLKDNDLPMPNDWLEWLQSEAE